MINLKIISSKLSNKIHTIKSTIKIAGKCKKNPSHKVALLTQEKVSSHLPSEMKEMFLYEKCCSVYTVCFHFSPY